MSCGDDSETVKSIQDTEGVIFEVNVKNPTPSTDYPWVGMVGYYPDKKVYFSGHDSIGVEPFYPDGEYQIDIRNYETFDIQTDYEFKISGISSLKSYQFSLTFDNNDTLRTIKKSIFVTKNNGTYTIREGK